MQSPGIVALVIYPDLHPFTTINLMVTLFLSVNEYNFHNSFFNLHKVLVVITLSAN